MLIFMEKESGVIINIELGERPDSNGGWASVSPRLVLGIEGEEFDDFIKGKEDKDLDDMPIDSEFIGFL